MNNKEKKFPMDVFPSCSSIGGIRMWAKTTETIATVPTNTTVAETTM